MTIDMHLSAEAIGSATITELENSGFKQDFFQNNRNSAPPHYHASYRTHLNEPNDRLWEKALILLKGDSEFRGCLEEESFGNLRLHFDTRSLPEIRAHRAVAPFTLETCTPGEHKACDIHINVDLELTSAAALAEMEHFNFISFERVVGGKTRRIYSLTFESVETGEQIFHRLGQKLKTIPGLVGKMKLECVTRFMVHPCDAAQLPIVRDAFAQTWLMS